MNKKTNYKKKMEKGMKLIAFFPRPIIKIIEKLLRKSSTVQKVINKQSESIISDLRKSLKPYSGKLVAYSKLPEKGIKQNKVLQIINNISSDEEFKWKNGYVSGAVYHGDIKHIEFMNKVYALQSQSNPLHSDLFPSSSKFESEIVSMTAEMLGSNKTDDEICGTVTSGGTESILLAMKTYRDKARKIKNITKPEIIVPITAHAAFNKAAEYFGIKIIRTKIDKNYRGNYSYKIRNIFTNNVPNFVNKRKRRIC